MPSDVRHAPAEVEREALRLFRRLAVKGAYLVLVGGKARGMKSEEFGVYIPRNRFHRPVATVVQSYVTAFKKRDWLEEGTQSTLRLSEAGLAWLRRALAGGDAFREQHQLRTNAFIEKDGQLQRPVVVNQGESPLGWLRRRKGRNGAPLLSQAQYDAGERLRADLWLARMTPRVTASWEAPASGKRMRRAAPGGSAELTDTVLAAKTRVDHALDTVGPELASILVDVCGHLMGIEETEKANEWPQRSGKIILAMALTRLARHYGLLAGEGKGGSSRRRPRHWGAEGYRPVVDGV